MKKLMVMLCTMLLLFMVTAGISEAVPFQVTIEGTIEGFEEFHGGDSGYEGKSVGDNVTYVFEVDYTSPAYNFAEWSGQEWYDDMYGDVYNYFWADFVEGDAVPLSLEMQQIIQYSGKYDVSGQWDWDWNFRVGETTSEIMVSITDADGSMSISAGDSVDFRDRINTDADFGYNDALGSATVTYVSESIPYDPLNPAPVPEPATIFLLGTGLVGLIGFRRKFKK